MDAQAEAAAPLPIYNDFEPFCQWQREKDKDTLVVQLPSGFKKEHLKVLVSNQGLIRFSGECNTDGNNWSRFKREIRVAKECNVDGIQAKFLRGSLHIIMPKTNDSIGVQEQPKPKPEVGNEKELESADKGRNEVEGSVSRGKKMAVSGFVVVALLVALGAYAAHYYPNLINFIEN